MTPSNFVKVAFSAVLISTLAAGLLSLTAEPASAQLPGGGLNCNFYSRPGCEFSHILDASPPEAPDSTYCCVFEGPNCRFDGGTTRVGPCWLSLPPCD